MNNNSTPNVKDHVTEQEWQMRVNLAACYRLIASYGWDDLVFTHISARVPDTEDEFLINPYGLLFEEITASNLVKVNQAGEKVSSSAFDINPAGFTIHSAVHEARNDAHCVIHLHTSDGVAVSTQQQGLLPISQQSLFPLSNLAYHDYEGVALNPEEKVRLVSDLGEANFMILRNHGLLTCASSVADAFLYMYIMQRACEVQIKAQSGGSELTLISPQILAGIQAASKQVTKEANGDIAWPALLRKLRRTDPSFEE
ncbi:class II aldolase/adducin family protein [Psychrobacter sp. N25K4-3-2]|jgi:ribulose-5-phosphate 4-epimerase/fuculose-1-phosphate aldolase|uniref:class II aldolase/adducin family protein n=1 Tax=Psychrobacter TaxID=497 RepID=UPI00188C4E92|nr:class II aldolase/adducin family protein [Psychrobacter sp. N25K4-3-2]MBF4488670.1 class II aldolase/adducin family protein [Psychrobacter sp. N25K4-3-2]